MRLFAWVLLALLSLATHLAAQSVHDVLLEGDSASGRYRFTPAHVSARPGEVLRFVVRSGPPHTIVFATAGLSARVRAALDAALPDRLRELEGPLLVRVGTEYRVTVPAIPAGAYRFFCLAHFAQGMSGELTVVGRTRIAPP
ncbi:MAG: plastocyanin/azurin family copper-binding protein [Gemmatimonadales bacterium]